MYKFLMSLLCVSYLSLHAMEDKKRQFLHKLRQNASQYNRDQFLELLTQAHKEVGPLGNSINRFVTETEFRPLHFAITSRDREFLLLLLKHNINPLQKNSNNKTAQELCDIELAQSQSDTDKRLLTTIKTDLQKYTYEFNEEGRSQPTANAGKMLQFANDPDVEAARRGYYPQYNAQSKNSYSQANSSIE